MKLVTWYSIILFYENLSLIRSIFNHSSIRKYAWNIFQTCFQILSYLFLRRMSLYISYIPPCPIFALTSSLKELLGSTFSDVVPLNIARSFSKKLDSRPSYRRLISRNVFAISRLVQAKRHHYVSSSWHPSRLISRRYAPLYPFLTRAHSILTLFNVHILWNKVRLREHVCSDILKHVPCRVSCFSTISCQQRTFSILNFVQFTKLSYTCHIRCKLLQKDSCGSIFAFEDFEFWLMYRYISVTLN